MTATDSEGGYYEVTKDAKHTFDGIITNNFFKGNVYVTLQKGQYIKLIWCKLKV